MHSRVDVHVAKRLWNFLRIAFFMMRKGLISKRKIIMDMNLMMKRGKVLGKSLGNLMFHHHHDSRDRHPYGYGLQDYEFSCSNSPNPVFFHVGKRKHHHYFPHFPCINVRVEEDPAEPDEQKAVIVLPKTVYSPECSFDIPAATEETLDLGVGEKLSPMLSPFSGMASLDYSSEEDDEINGSPATGQVDKEAEEFIRRFYEQLRVQRRTALLQYQEMQYQEMLARGTG